MLGLIINLFRKRRHHASVEGYLARLTGVPKGMNPYPEDPRQKRQWEAAWDYAERRAIKND